MTPAAIWIAFSLASWIFAIHRDYEEPPKPATKSHQTKDMQP